MRINDTGKNWRHVFKGLIVLEYLVAHGSERDEIMEHGYQISSLAEFQYIDSNARDQGITVRRKSHDMMRSGYVMLEISKCIPLGY